MARSFLSPVTFEKRVRAREGFLNVDLYGLVRHAPEGPETMVREVLERGASVAILPYDPVRDTVLTVEEFRIGPLAAGCSESDWALPGPVAGVVDPGESPVEAALREAQEEAGVRIDEEALFDPMTILPSPGGSSEVVTLLLAETDLSDVREGRFGASGETEETSVRIMTRVEALRLIMSRPVSGHLTALMLRLETMRLSGAFTR